MSNSADRRLIHLLTKMEALHASDVFLTEGKKPGVRIDGSMRVVADMEPVTGEELEALLARAAGEKRHEEFERHGDLDVGMSLTADSRFRLNWSRQQGMLGCVIRAVPSGALDIEKLGLPKVIERYATFNRGLVLVTGATGSGKTTTLAAIVHRINSTRPVHVVTVEDPIEYVHSDLKARVSQREVGSDTRSYQVALRHVVRQSPDVIVVGELRDVDSVGVAVSAALTGHLVLATFHTADVVQTLQRALSYFPEHQRAQAAVDLSLCLNAIVSQRLVPTKDGQGRVLACEVLTVTPAIRKLLREQRLEEIGDQLRTSRSDEVQTFTTSLLSLLKSGQIHHDVGMAYSSNPDEFALYAKGMTTGAETFEAGSGETSGLDMRDLLTRSMDRQASDLHLTVGRPPIIRVSGALEAIGHLRLSDADMRMLLYSIMTARQRSIYEIEREVDFSLAVDGGRRYRVNAYYQKGYMAAALRAIPSTPPQAETLGLPEIILELGSRPHGLLLVVGPTGSGKSTTLACLVDRINRSRPCRIITIEDPIEYTHESRMATVDQREVFADTKSFSAALKYILRQDPDVILVGEMRDFETISAALTAAETGHLVFATLHSNDAVQAIDRVVDVFPAHQQSQARTQLAASLIGVVSQRLVPRADESGRLAAFEVMVATTGIRNLIREHKMHQALGLMEAGKREGSTTLDAAMIELVESGLVEYDEAARIMRDPRRLTRPLPEEGDPRDLAGGGGMHSGGGSTRGTRSTGSAGGRPSGGGPVRPAPVRPEKPGDPDGPHKKGGSRWPWRSS